MQALFLQNILYLHQQICVILRVDSLALWTIINGEDAILIPKIKGKKFSNEFLHYELVGVGRGVPLCPHSIDCCFVSES
jgi:hypothetical protein